MDDVGFLLARGSARAVRAANAELENHGLRARHYALLQTCAEGGASQRCIANTLGLDPSIVVSIVDDLEGRGLVERCADPDDRRSKLVTLTPDGSALAQRGSEAVSAAQRKLLAGLDEADQAELGRLLRQMLGAL